MYQLHKGYEANCTIANCPIASTYTYQSEEHNTHRTFRGNITILIPACIIQVGEIIQIFHGQIIRVKEIKVEKTIKISMTKEEDAIIGRFVCSIHYKD